MSILTGFEKQKRYKTDANGDHVLISEWTSTDTTSLSSNVDSAETTLADATAWLTAYDNANTQPELLTNLISKLTTYMSNVKYLKNELDAIKTVDQHPVGSLYWSSQSTDPSTLFGGTWERVKDKFIMAAGDTYAPGSPGGLPTATFTPSGTVQPHSFTLTANQLPPHTHTLNEHTHSIPELSGTALSAGAHTHGYDYPNWWGSGTGSSPSANGCGWEGYHGSYNTTSDGSHTHSIKTNSNTTGKASGNTGSSGSGAIITLSHTFSGTETTINILPPYKAYYCWERTA